MKVEYKKGVREIVSRAREVNPEIGDYQVHKPSGPDHFQITLSNGTLILPRQVAYSQQEFPTRVSAEWIAEIAHTFEKSSVEARAHASLIDKILNRFRGK